MIAVPVRRLSALSCALVRQEASAPSRRDGFVVSLGCPLVVCPRRHPRCGRREWLEGRSDVHHNGRLRNVSPDPVV